MSKTRQYREAAERKRDPRAWEVEPVEYWFTTPPIPDFPGNKREPIDLESIKTPFDRSEK